MESYNKMISVSNKSYCSYDVNWLLLLCGDVHGPRTRYPYAMCYCPIVGIKRLYCVMFVVCGHTVAKCCNISDLEYSRYKELDNFSWNCPSCTVKMHIIGWILYWDLLNVAILQNLPQLIGDIPQALDSGHTFVTCHLKRQSQRLPLFWY